MHYLSIPILLSSFIVIFTAEMPDKTAIALMVLSLKHKTAGLILGALLAFAIQTIVGVFLGSVLSILPQKPVHFISAAAFIAFAIFAFRRKEDQIVKEEKQETEKNIKHYKKAFLTSFFLIFALEWGDLSQMATAFLVAKTGNPLSVGMGSLLAVWIVAVMAVILGKQLARKLDLPRLNLISAVFLLIVGFIIFISGFS